MHFQIVVAFTIVILMSVDAFYCMEETVGAQYYTRYRFVQQNSKQNRTQSFFICPAGGNWNLANLNEIPTNSYASFQFKWFFKRNCFNLTTNKKKNFHFCLPPAPAFLSGVSFLFLIFSIITILIALIIFVAAKSDDRKIISRITVKIQIQVFN